MPPAENQFSNIVLGKHFTLHEMTISQEATRRGIANVPSDWDIGCLRDLVSHVLDPLRERLGKAILVSSGYRSKALNVAIGGASNSQHCVGQAADINVKGMTPAELASAIRKFNLPFDQLIEEFGQWVHVSYSAQHRREFLIARTVNGKTVYTKS
ncbi:D-Ala-D-Ala carboxypeptidase family metallohydrolase [Dyella sp. ASV21]|uniref:D-Ala-D-Ala carboxypeptidase family metallohydrolase n=1 Tax=Dyella sp. ASV21 TaxID=2795114 RepID=UPI0018ED11AF